VSAHQNAAHNDSLYGLGNGAKLRHLGTTLTNQNFIHEEIKSGLNSGYDCYSAVVNHLSSRLIFKDFMLKIYTGVVIRFAFYGCET
jgi:hypothetical protein